MLSNAAMWAGPEGRMNDFFAVDVKLPRVGACLRVTRGRSKVKRHTVSRLDLNTADFDIGPYRAPDSNNRRMQPDLAYG